MHPYTFILLHRVHNNEAKLANLRPVSIKLIREKLGIKKKKKTAAFF